MSKTLIHKIKQHERKSFSQIERDIWDKHMSTDACAVLAYLLSRTDEWRVNTKHIAKQFGGFNERRARQTFRELERFGHMKIQGHGATIRYDVYERSILRKSDDVLL